MNFTIQRERIQKLLSARNGYMTLAAGTLLVCILQMVLIFMLLGREKIFLVPPTVNKSFWVSAQQVSSEYLAEMSAYFVQLRFNVTPSAIDQQRELLLRYVDPSAYPTLKSTLVKEGDRIRHENLSMTFYPVSTWTDTKQLIAMIEGDLKAFIGETALPTKRIKLKIAYTYHAGRLQVQSFEEVKRD